MQATRHFHIALGHLLRKMRLSAGMTQKELAQKLDVSFQQVQKYERGANRLSIDQLWLLSCLFNVPVSYWYNAMPTTERQAKKHSDEPSAYDLPSDRSALVLLQAYQSISRDSSRQMLCRLAQEFASYGDSPLVRM